MPEQEQIYPTSNENYERYHYDKRNNLPQRHYDCALRVRQPQFREKALALSHSRRCMHAHDLQPAIWVDPVRLAPPTGAWLGDSPDSGGLHLLHRTRDLGNAARRLDRGQTWAGQGTAYY